MSESSVAPARRREVLRQSWSVGIATGAYGISFGALAVSAGLNVWQTQALSALMFTGGSQFAFIGIIGAGGLAAAPAAIATAAQLGLRNGLYAIQNALFLGVRGPRRVAAAQLTIDESTAVGMAQEEPSLQRAGFWHTGIAVFVFWNLATLLGAVLGNALGDPRQWGLDAAAAAAFVALLWPRLRSRDAIATAVLAAFIACLASPFVPAGVPVILTVLAALIVGLSRSSPRAEKLESDGEGHLIGEDPLP